MSKILMSHGTMFDVANPDPKLVNLDEIVHHLDHKCRFGGGTSQFYSVAEHSMVGALIAYECALPFLDGIKEDIKLDIAKMFLLHDAAEAYIGDIPTPVKRMLGDKVVSIEKNIMHAIISKLWPEWFGFNFYRQDLVNDWVKEIDQAMLAIERNLFMPDHEDWRLEMPELKKGTRSSEWLSHRFSGNESLPGEGVEGFKRFYHELFVEGDLQLN
jgi:uncharacterized protein